MDVSKITAMLFALGQATRLEAFRMLRDEGDEGIAAGVLADRLGTPHNTLSAHLKVLEQAGLIASKRVSRSIIYKADEAALEQLVDYIAPRSKAAPRG